MVWRAALCLSLGLLIGGCGARKAPTAANTAAPESAAPTTTPAWVELPDPTRDTIEILDAREPIIPPSGAFFPNATDLFTLEQNHRASVGVSGSVERGQHAFWISRVTGETATHRHVHCATARVFGTASTAALDRDSRVADQWVLRVAPEPGVKGGPRAVALTWYRHIVKYHELAYIGRDKGGVALYQYIRPRPVPEGS